MLARHFSMCIIPLVRNTLRRTLNETQIINKPQILSNLSVPIRNYAKSKDKGKEKGSKKGGKVEVNPMMMSELIDVEKLKSQCSSVIDSMKNDFAKNLSLRSTTGSIENIRLQFEGKNYEIQELAQIIRKNPKTIVLNFTSFPNVIPAALKAIQNSGLNLNPQQDGTTLFIPVPKVTKEHREMLAKNAKIMFIKHRDQLKEIQTSFLKRAKKQTNVSEDLLFNVSKQITVFFEQQQNELKTIYNQKHVELLGKS